MADIHEIENIGVFKPPRELISFSETLDYKIQNGGTHTLFVRFHHSPRKRS